jgi:hypothetical protein
VVSRRTLWLVIAAAIFNAFLVGGFVDRAVVAMPAWAEIGAQPWAQFSRHADLGNGIVLYPLEAIGGVVLTGLAAVSGNVRGVLQLAGFLADLWALVVVARLTAAPQRRRWGLAPDGVVTS